MTETAVAIQRRWIALALLCVAQFVVVLDASIVTTTFRDGAERNRALGVWGAVAGSGGAAGVLLGGALTQGPGWEWVFWVNVPIGVIAAAIAPSLIAESRAETETRHFDFAGAVSVTGGLSLLVYALVDANNAGWGSARTIALLAASAALLIAFTMIERRSRAPLVPFSIFGLRTVSGANVVGLLATVTLIRNRDSREHVQLGEAAPARA